MLGSRGRRGCGPRTRKSETTWPRSPSQYGAPAATWPKPACQSSSVICSRLPRRSLPRRRHRSPGCVAKALVALWEALPANASHDGAFDFPHASRSLFDAVAEVIGLMPMVRELEARLAADVEFKGGGA